MVRGLIAWLTARLSRKLNAPVRLADAAGEPRDRIWLGSFGEDVAAAYLRSKGYRILARNLRGRRGGEVDVVAAHGRLLLFVEVKTRKADTKIRPLDAVDKTKQALITRGADAWLRRLGTREVPWRFDVIEILVSEGRKPEVRHVRDAF